MSLKTKDLPVGERPNMFYKAAAVAFELRTAKTSGNPYINVTLQRVSGGKRFDNIFLKPHWFEHDFDAKKITDAKERNLFFREVGKIGRSGKLLTYLPPDFEGEFVDGNELVQALNNVAVGRQVWVQERQRVDPDTQIPTQQYNLTIYPLDHPPLRSMNRPEVLVYDKVDGEATQEEGKRS